MPKRHVVFLILVAILMQSCRSETVDLSSTIIVNAVVFDGSGANGYKGAVRIDGERIVEVGNLSPRAGETVIDAGGLVVTPGFIDTHSHHDSRLDDYRGMPGVLSQGITTIVRGMDGFSDESNELRYVPLSNFTAKLRATPAAVNIASYSPHNSIRYEVLGKDFRREATDAEVAAMGELLKADLTAGALGLATGLEYDPGNYSTTEELITLSRIAAAVGGRYVSHIRDEDEGFIEALQEIIRISSEADVPVHVSHIKVADREYWGRGRSVVEMLSAARANGIEISADIYPYVRWASDFSPLFPERDLGSVAAAEYAFAHTGAPDDIVISHFPENTAFVGKTLAEIATLSEQDYVSTLLSLAQKADDYLQRTGLSGANIIVKGMHEHDVATLMQWDFTNICSDGTHGGGHPRGYGAFPRVLGHYVRELGVLSLADALFKMTGQSADAMGIPQRGRLQPGHYADITLFDPDTITDHATMEDSTAVSTGIFKVWVNGVLAFENDALTGRYAGRIISRKPVAQISE